ncbi:protein-methionine-sulfoxide reductase catalytic subunit MsrP [Roseospira marina]|uniref:Protein-methionine-sulfoxide reductase catalytic subunit MsrP n=1 Tax=Roseospira marina TaxID=140057 RepID=A0A5M6I965_9PROT|nr:protein-methionine-sulfoxide reductase catalytic subunit MsrP [Roseospira marina]KAA5604305.1 protein-methionine-sulfoxide reductase catalytic subunit MsrP [Roseospira marina]MBB4315671.1 sulfoxide reductase catalytic subunit YedY [Roseospira marina]MBB5088729.1 sulfoxide reductase catalytic subunit YedY [Roseospira marina]
MLFRFRSPADPTPSDITPEGVYLNRRRLMQGAGVTALTGLAGGAFGLAGLRSARAAEPGDYAPLPDVQPSAFSTDEDQNDFDDITTYNNFYEFGTSKDAPSRYADQMATSPWEIRVEGACAKPGTLGVADLIERSPLEERIYRLRCVEAWSMVIPWVGIPLASVLQRFEPTGNAKYVAFETLEDPSQMPGQRSRLIDWPYREGLRIDEAMNPLTILAVGLYGRAMPNQNGAPVRLIVPWKYGFKSIKSIVRIAFTEDQPATSWNRLQPSEYGFYANVNPNVDHPRWSQARERRIGDWGRRDTLMFNGYGEQVASLYRGMDLKANY